MPAQVGEGHEGDEGQAERDPLVGEAAEGWGCEMMAATPAEIETATVRM